MIKSKIDARERALGLASDFCREHHLGKLLETAKEIEKYLIGDAELPELVDDNAHIKELLEIANKSFDNSRKFSCEAFGDNAGLTEGISGTAVNPDAE